MSNEKELAAQIRAALIINGLWVTDVQGEAAVTTILALVKSHPPIEREK